MNKAQRDHIATKTDEQLAADIAQYEKAHALCYAKVGEIVRLQAYREELQARQLAKDNESDEIAVTCCSVCGNDELSMGDDGSAYCWWCEDDTDKVTVYYTPEEFEFINSFSKGF